IVRVAIRFRPAQRLKAICCAWKFARIAIRFSPESRSWSTLPAVWSAFKRSTPERRPPQKSNLIFLDGGASCAPFSFLCVLLLSALCVKFFCVATQSRMFEGTRPSESIGSAPPRVTLRNSFNHPFDSAIAAARTCYADHLITTEEITDKQRLNIGAATF